jgi:6-pyruvoyltetrahydropterin/6-carboxytetrahydropterin synthase
VTYRIEKDFPFSASHQLDGLPEGHQCGRLHGHNYVVRVQLAAPLLNPVGFVLDYGDLAPFKTWVDTHLDHRHLNDVEELENPTAEHLAFFLAKVLRVTVMPSSDIALAVGISETPKTWAWFCE